MAARISGRKLKVRGATRAGGSPRLTPQEANSRLQLSATPEVLTTPDVTLKPQTKFDILAAKPSKWGGTDLERAVDNAAAELGYSFDGAQWYVQLPMSGSYTIVDRVRFRPSVAVYIDGIQHDLRADAEAQDFIQKIALEAEGWKVIRLHWRDIQRDPIGAARSVLYVV